MQYEYFSKNGQVLPSSQAVVSLDNIAYSYGFGVYESIRVSKGLVYFGDEHIERLLSSARILGIEHSFSEKTISQSISKTLEANLARDCNIKMLLIGGTTKDSAVIYIMCLNPFYPDRNLYKQGCKAITYETERPSPHAKSLNMLQSYQAYREAKRVDAYDALLINRIGHITEGTRTNFLALSDRIIVSPPENEILLGVMRKVVLKVAAENNFKIEEDNISLADLDNYDGAFLTSTSSKIMPIKSINDHKFPSISTELKELMHQTTEFLKTCSGKL